jgi:protein O-mannosyl-transferase
MRNRNKTSIKNTPKSRSGVSNSPALPFRMVAGAAILIATTFVAYIPSLSCGFIWDDDSYLTNSLIIRAPDGLYKFWCTNEAIDYYPISNTSLWIEWRLWGMNARGYHAFSLILHIAESLLIWIVLRKISVPGAFLTAMIFAVHPVNVESVAWIAQRKDMLAFLFFLLSILWYLKFLACPRVPLAAKQTLPTAHRPLPTSLSFILHPSSFARWYCLSLISFALGMLSKGSVATLPVILLAIVWWLRSLEIIPSLVQEGKHFSTQEGRHSCLPLDKSHPRLPFDNFALPPFISRLLRPLTLWDVFRTVPFFLVAVLITLVHVWFQTKGTGEVLRAAGLIERLLGAGGVVWFYLYKALLPINLVFVYPQWDIQPGNPLWWMPLGAVIIVTAVLYWYRESWGRPFFFAWGFFCVALIPVMGFSDVVFFRYSLVADHYQHIAIIAVIAIVSAPWSLLYRHKNRVARRAAALVAVAAIGILAVLTWRQCGFYHDGITLYEYTLEKNPKCWMAHNNMGSMFLNADRLDEAAEHFRRALEIKPDNVEAHNNLGIVFSRRSKFQEGIEYFQKALKLNPQDPNAHNNYGLILAYLDRYPEAIEQYRQALQFKPKYPDAHNNLGLALAQLNQPKEAIEHYRQALALRPDYLEAHYNLGLALSSVGQVPEAIEHYQRALELKPDYAEAYFNLALAYAAMRQFPQAHAAAQQSLNLARSQNNAALAKQIEEWISSLRASLAK